MSKIFDLKGQLKRSLSEGAVEVTFSPGGRVLACVTPDHGLRSWLWESTDGKEALPEMRDVIHAAFAFNKPVLATLHRDGRLRMWSFSPDLSVAERWSVYVCPDPTALVNSREGDKVAVGCKDGRVQVYEGNAGTEMARAEYPGEVESVAFSAKPPVFIAGGRDGMKAYYLDRADLLREACARVSANLTRDQWNRDIGGGCRTVCPSASPGCGR